MVRRIDNLTGLRGYAALWVVTYHAVILYRPYTEVSGFVGHGFYGVDAFFVLSGFVLSLVYVPRFPQRVSSAWYKNFLVKRLAKIYPMHLMALGIMIGVLGAAKVLFHKPDTAMENTPWTAICQVLLLHAFGVNAKVSWNVASWSVSAEWFAYAILFVPMLYGLRRWPALWVAGAVALLWTGLVGSCVLVFQRDIGLTTLGIFRITPEFTAGYLLFRWVQGRRLHGEVLVFTGLALLVGICYLPPWYVLLLLPALMLILAGLYFGGPVVDSLFGNSVALQVGEASYSIYLLQQIVFIGVDQLLKRGLHVGEGMLLSWPWIPAVVATVYTTGRAAFLYVEEPLRVRILRRFGANRRNPEALVAPPPSSGLQADTETAATIS